MDIHRRKEDFPGKKKKKEKKKEKDCIPFSVIHNGV